MLWKYDANASDYKDAPLAYGNAKKELLKNNGWDPKNYEAMSERISGIYNSMQDQKDIDQEKNELKDQLAEIESNVYIAAEQKAMLKEAVLQTINERQKMVDLFKPDWPAFKPYLEKYEQLDLWISKNRENPPVIN